MQSLKIEQVRVTKDENGIYLVALDIISTNELESKKSEVLGECLLSTEQAAELINRIKFYNYTAKSQNSKNI